MLIRCKTSNKKHNQLPPVLESTTPLLMPQHCDSEYGEPFLLAVSSSLAQRGFKEYFPKGATKPAITGHTAADISFRNYNPPTPSSSSVSFSAELSQTLLDYTMQPRKSTYFQNGKEPDPPPESPHALARTNSEQNGKYIDASGKALQRKYSASGQVSRGLSKRKSGRIPLECNAEGITLGKIETNKSQVSVVRSQGDFVRSYNIPNAIVAPAFRLARVVSIPSIEEGAPLTSQGVGGHVIPFPIRAQSVMEYSPGASSLQAPSVPAHRVKVSRSIRSFWKSNFGNSTTSIISEFDDNSSEEGDRNINRSKKSMFNLRRSRAREMEDNSVYDPENLSFPIAQQLCTRLCGIPRCFHDCDVLHVKNSAGHDCLVIEMILGKPTIIAGTLEGLMVELCAPITERSDPTFTDRFLRTCGNFCSPIETLKLLTEQHERNREPSSQRRVVEVIIRWLRTQPEDLFEREKLSPVLSNFVEKVNRYGYQTWNRELQSTCEKALKKVESYHEFWKVKEQLSLHELIETALQGVSVSLGYHECGVMNIDTGDLAKYFAALDLILFRDASENRTLRAWCRSLTGSSLKNSEEGILVDRVDRVLHRANMIRDWVGFEILSAPTNKLSALYIAKFIELAKNLYSLGNLQTTLCITDAITSEEVTRTACIWEEAPSEMLQLLEKLRPLQTEIGYAKALSEACLPVVPYLRHFLNQVRKAEAETFYFQDAGNKKRHMDIGIDKCGYTHCPGGYNFSLTSNRSQEPPLIFDMTKHGSFYYQISLARQKAWRAHNFERLSRQAWIFNLYVPGRSAFCKTTLGDKPNRNSNFSQESITLKNSMTQNRKNSLKEESNLEDVGFPVRYHGRSSDASKYPPSPPITPPTSTYFESKRISSINGPGGLDWISEPVERRVVEAQAWLRNGP